MSEIALKLVDDFGRFESGDIVYFDIDMLWDKTEISERQRNINEFEKVKNLRTGNYVYIEKDELEELNVR